MPDELPPLDKFVVSGFSEGDPDFPIVVVVKDSRAPGYARPATLAACPDPRFSSTHKLVSITPTNVDNRLIWTYEILPGPSLTTQRYDSVSDAMVSTIRTKKVLSTITEGVEKINVGGAESNVITESDPVTEEVGYEVKTILPQPVAHDAESAITISKEILPFQFPGTLDVSVWLTTSGAIGTAPPFIKRVPHVKKVFWVIDETPPALVQDGLIEFSQQHGLLGADLGETVYDETTFGPYTFPGSIPNLTTYLADWVGGAPRVIGGGVYRDGGKFRWRVEQTFVQYIVARPATVT